MNTHLFVPASRQETAAPRSSDPSAARISLGNERTASQLAKHLLALHRAATRIGFSPEVTGPLSKAATVGEIEARQMACPHAHKATCEFTSHSQRVEITMCVDCRKTLRTRAI